MLFILQNNLLIEESDKHPLKCFQHKRNIFYKYESCIENNIENNKWIQVTHGDFSNLLVHLNHYLMKEFITWRDEHKGKIETSEQFYDVFMANMRIILGGNKSKQENIQSIQSKLFQYLKCDLKAIYEFEF
jgi:hypothetical protein